MRRISHRPGGGVQVRVLSGETLRVRSSMEVGWVSGGVAGPGLSMAEVSGMLKPASTDAERKARVSEGWCSAAVWWSP